MHGRILREITCACLVGDGSLTKNKKKQVRFRISHSRNQRDFCKWKMSLFKSFFEDHKIEKKLELKDEFQTVGYLKYKYPVSYFHFSWQKFLPTLYDKAYPYYKDRAKSYEYLLTQIYSPLHLAIWMGDDGNEDRGYSRSRTDKTKKYRRSPRYRLSVYSLTEGELNLVNEWFNRYFEVNPRIIHEKRGPILRFKVRESEVLFKLMYPYFSSLSSMRHKFRWSFEEWENK